MSKMSAKECIILARSNAAAGNSSKAFELYLLAFDILPRLKSAYKAKFLTVFTDLLYFLEREGDQNTLFASYKKALTVFPGESVILSEVGKYLLRHHHYLEAWYQFQQILRDDTSSVNADFYLNEVKLSLVQRWHYRMLNDKTRNFSYHAAIRETVESGKDSVLDLGAGTGLLSMYAAKCNPESIVGVEMVAVLSSMAQRLVLDNNFHSIRIVTESSQSLSDSDIGGKKSLLITEMFDVALFGEGIIRSLDHAFKNLLQEKGRVLPIGGEFFIRGIKCDSLMTRYYLNNKIKALLNIPLETNIMLSNDLYDSVDVPLYEDLLYMTDPESVLKIDFNNAKDLETKLSQVVDYNIKLNPLMSGEISTIVGWFNLYLTNNISLTTNPVCENRSTAWQQVIFSNFLPKEVQQNNPFTVTLQLINGLRLGLKTDTEDGMKIKISEYLMRFLNDEKYIETITSSADAAFMYLLQHIPVSDIVIADLSPFPIFGLMMLKGGVKSLSCYAIIKEDQDFIKNVFQAYDIHQDRYEIFNNPNHFLGDKKFHAIYYNIFDPRGNLDRTMLRITHFLEINNLIEGGLFLPYNIKVMGQLIHGPCLDFHNRVYDANTGYMIAHHMNKFQVSINNGLDFMNFKYTALSNPVILGYCRHMKPQIIECPVIKDGIANAVLCWYEIKVSQYTPSIATNRPKSFLDGVAFLADPQVQVAVDKVPDIICCVDDDHSFKVIIDNVAQ
ncbi:protein arginine N-methyltransferase 9-like [Epargyreus clarus]|uniref:protein arginine N-methyltransferase 9-like n=1 Tax=Epargyreus clarus TaxID=520877 RepID=UPI003C2F3C17